MSNLTLGKRLLLKKQTTDSGAPIIAEVTRQIEEHIQSKSLFNGDVPIVLCHPVTSVFSRETITKHLTEMGTKEDLIFTLTEAHQVCRGNNTAVDLYYTVSPVAPQ